MIIKKSKTIRQKMIEMVGEENIQDSEGRSDYLYDRIIKLKGNELSENDKQYYKEILKKYFK